MLGRMMAQPVQALDRGKCERGQMRRVQLVVCGSVAVNRTGARLGKGADDSDIEVALLTEAGLIGPSIVIVTTAHPLQVIEGPRPETGHDSRVDLIITPAEVRKPTGPPNRPSSRRNRSG